MIRYIFFPLFAVMTFLLFFSLPSMAGNTEDGELVIVLDPGHGGVQSGAEALDGVTQEKDINLKIARYLKEELKEYPDVKVYMTRDEDVDVSLDRRTEIAEELDADLLVSLHNNAYDGKTGYDHGAFVLTSRGNYKEDLAKEEQKLACNILDELSDIGLEEQGILLRDSETDQKYPNGKSADYYRIIKEGIMNDRMQVLIEHAFVDYESDFYEFLNTDDQLKQLARADARGIARYYGLKDEDTNEVLTSLSNYTEKLITFFEDSRTEVETMIFYPDDTNSDAKNAGSDEDDIRQDKENKILRFPYFLSILEMSDLIQEVGPPKASPYYPFNPEP